MAVYLERPIAHRGLHNDICPENSLSAFLRAMNEGFSIELDIRLTKDNVPIVFHDSTLERMTGAKGRVDQYTYKSLKKLNLLNSKERIPSLEEVFRLVEGKVPIIAELKTESSDYLLEQACHDLLKEYHQNYKICFQSFNIFTLKWFKEHFPRVSLGLLTTDRFDGVKLNFFKKQLVRLMPLAPILKPDYVGFNHEGFSALQLNFISKFTDAHMLFWTVRSKSDYEKVKVAADNIIFEGFNPYEE